MFLAGQAAARHMIERGSGRIIHISSVMGLIGEEFAPTALPRQALIGLTKVMALELVMLSDEDHHRSARCALPAGEDPRG